MNAETLIARITRLPAPSPFVNRLLELLNKPHADGHEIIQVVEEDNVLTSKLLRLSNSAIYALATPVSSIQQAVLHLGFREIYRQVLAISYGDRLHRRLRGYGMEEEELWCHSLLAARTAELVLTETAVACDPSVAYTAGLLHDIGKVVLDQVLEPPMQVAILELVEQKGQTRSAAERAILETDHAEVGGILLAEWHLPEIIVEAVRHHHEPPLTPAPGLSVVVHVANCLAHQAGAAPGKDGEALRAAQPAAEVLGMNAATLEQLASKTTATLGQIREMVAVV